MVSDLNIDKFSHPTSSLFRTIYIERKQHRIAFFNKNGRRTTKPLEIVHSDVCSSMRTTSIGNARYTMTFIDDFSRKAWLYMLKSNKECFERFNEFKVLVKMQLEHKIKTNGRTMVGSTFPRHSSSF